MAKNDVNQVELEEVHYDEPVEEDYFFELEEVHYDEEDYFFVGTLTNEKVILPTGKQL